MATYLLPTARNLLTGQRQKIQDLTGDRLTESQRSIAEEKAQQLADKLTAKTRERLFDEIRAKALCFAIAEASVEEIDRLNILQATMLAMQRAVEALRLKPTLVYVDGNRLPILDVRAEAIVKGDEKIQEISAASILAKVHRDRMCDEMHRQYPAYGFDAHKGYGTAVHLKALQTWGATPFHRQTFAPVTQAILAARKP